VSLTLSALVVAIAVLAATPALPADDTAWPNRPVRVIATSPPGGSIDLLARILAQELTKEHGLPFVVENRPGANGDLGVAAVLRAPADGHWFFVAPAGPFSINLNLRSSMPFNPATDIAPVTMLAVTPLVSWSTLRYRPTTCGSCLPGCAPNREKQPTLLRRSAAPVTSRWSFSNL